MSGKTRNLCGKSGEFCGNMWNIFGYNNQKERLLVHRIVYCLVPIVFLGLIQFMFIQNLPQRTFERFIIVGNLFFTNVFCSNPGYCRIRTGGFYLFYIGDDMSQLVFVRIEKWFQVLDEFSVHTLILNGFFNQLRQPFVGVIYINSSLKFEIMAKQLYVASQRVL